MKIYKGKTKSILDSAIDAALVAVENYNKPRSRFRIENYIMLMVVAWTRLMHAYFNKTIGDKYYYKNDTGTRYKIIQGEKQAWDLSKCIREFKKSHDKNLLSAPIEANINFFIMLRNKIAHRYIEKNELESLLFGEFQSFLYNFETFVINIFGEEFALEETLSYSIQFSTIRGLEQISSNKRALSTEMQDLKQAVNKYRTKLSQNILDSQEYSIKILLIPKISNTKANDVAVEFIKPNKKSYEDVIGVLTKDKVQRVEATNIKKLLPSGIVQEVNKRNGNNDFKIHIHTWLCKLFAIRPYTTRHADGDHDPFDTKTKYCLYDEAHKNYVYTIKWVDSITKIMGKLSMDQIKEYVNKKATLEIEKYSE